MIKAPKISALIRTKNSEITIENCLSSICTQTIGIWEIVVVDSGSTDRTLQLCEPYGVTLIQYPTDMAFNYSKALNIGIGHCSGEYILIISSHVSFTDKDTLRLMFAELTSNEKVVAVSTKRAKGNEFDSQQLKTNVTKEAFRGRAMYNYCSLIAKDRWRLRVFNEEIPTAEDQEWAWYHLRNYDFQTVIIHNPTVKYSNPYYNFRKDLNEQLAIGRYVYPDLITYSNLTRRFFRNFRLLRQSKLTVFIAEQRNVLLLFIFKAFNLSANSVYNSSQ